MTFPYPTAADRVSADGPSPALVDSLITIAHLAGDAILDVYARDFDVAYKSDQSPVTEADTRAEAIIIDALRALTPDIPIVAEEAMAAGGMPPGRNAADLFWLVDPLDGTREFIARNGEFTVNIGLIRNGRPIAGVVHCPALEITYAGAGAGTARMRTRHENRAIACRPRPAEGVTLIASRRHGDTVETDAFLKRFLGSVPIARRISAGSSLKFCKIAEGAADLYPRLGPTCEWDTAAGHAVLIAAGGTVTTLDGVDLTYGKAPGYKNPFFVACGPRPV